VTNPNDWFKKKERRGQYYGGKRCSFDAYNAKTDDEDEVDRVLQRRHVRVLLSCDRGRG